MKVYMLLESRLRPVPPVISISRMFNEHVEVLGTKESANSVWLAKGSQVELEGPEEEFIKWLSPFEYVYVMQGNPQEQRFVAMHIKGQNET